MNLGELKLAIKDIKGIKNVTDFDLQVENSQSKMIYTDEAQLIARGTTVQVKRVPLPRGEKKTWRQERENRSRDPVAAGEVTSTSEEGRMDEVLAVSGQENSYAHGIPSSMLVSAGDTAATGPGKLDKFGQVKLTAVEMEGYGSEKVESHDWLKEDEDSTASTGTKEAADEDSTA